MKPQKEPPEQAEPAFESDALRLSDIDGRDGVAVHENEPPGLVEDEQEIAARDGARRILLAAAAVGVAAAVAIGLKLAYDRRKSSRARRMVAGHLEDARDALMSVASELPERGREVLHHLKHR